MYTIFYGAKTWYKDTMQEAYKFIQQLNRMQKGRRYGIIQNAMGIQKHGRTLYAIRACGDEIIARWNW